MRTRYTGMIKEIATAHGLDPDMVEAVVLQESAGNTDAFRFEPDFWNRYMKGKPQWTGANPRRVSSSYGLMQIMYPVALEIGYSTDHPPEMLFVPEVGLTWGCQKLRQLADWAAGLTVPAEIAKVEPNVHVLAGLAAYNGGRGGNNPAKNWPLRNGRYAREVVAKWQLLDSGK